ncbi:ethanolamine kinase 1-like [Arapaima gigas]
MFCNQLGTNEVFVRLDAFFEQKREDEENKQDRAVAGSLPPPRQPTIYLTVPLFPFITLHSGSKKNTSTWPTKRMLLNELFCTITLKRPVTIVTEPDTAMEPLLHLNMTVDESDPKSGILVLLRKVRPQWKPEDIKFKIFTEGLTNQLLGCYVDPPPGEMVLVRIYGKGTELLVNRKREMETFQMLYAHNCGPQLYCSFQNGISYEFIRGEVMDEKQLRQPSVYRLVAQEMARIHSIRPENGTSARPVLWKKVSEMLCLVQDAYRDSSPCRRSRLASAVPHFDVVEREIEALKKHLSTVKSQIVLCHNDLLIKNIVYNQAEGCVRFIDYEFADFNYQAYDIGNHFNEFAGVNDVDYSLYPSQELQTDWLTTYLQSYKQRLGLEPVVSNKELQELYVQVCKFSLVAHFTWGLWALFQARHSTINFDFLR